MALVIPAVKLKGRCRMSRLASCCSRPSLREVPGLSVSVLLLIARLFPPTVAAGYGPGRQDCGASWQAAVKEAAERGFEISVLISVVTKPCLSAALYKHHVWIVSQACISMWSHSIQPGFPQLRKGCMCLTLPITPCN